MDEIIPAGAPPGQSAAPRSDLLPDRRLPIAWLAAAHLCLLVALAFLAADPPGLTGFFFHARLAAAVHFVTLGWITGSILGSLYIVCPMALRMPLPAGRLDWLAFWLWLAGASGTAGHFWIEEFSGVGYAGLAVLAAAALTGGRVLRGLRAARVPAAVKLHVALAFLNLFATGTLGILLAFTKHAQFSPEAAFPGISLPGSPLTNAYAHGHLAAIGWAGMMVAGVGYRMLPMVLPAAMPSGRSLWASALLLQAGAVGLFVSFLAGERPGIALPVSGGLAAAGFAAFLLHVAGMLRRPRPAPRDLPKPDLGVWHAMLSLLCLLAAAALGLALSVAPMSEATLRLAAVYGVLGLLGFLAQVVIGIESRLLPMFAAIWRIVDSGFSSDAPAPRALPSRGLQAAGFVLWAAGLPLLAAGVWWEAPALAAAGAWTLLAAAGAGAVNAARLLWPVWRGGRRSRR